MWSIRLTDTLRMFARSARRGGGTADALRSGRSVRKGVRVRIPLSAPTFTTAYAVRYHALVAQWIERCPAEAEVVGSSPAKRTIFPRRTNGNKARQRSSEAQSNRLIIGRSLVRIQPLLPPTSTPGGLHRPLFCARRRRRSGGDAEVGGDLRPPDERGEPIAVEFRGCRPAPSVQGVSREILAQRVALNRWQR